LEYHCCEGINADGSIATTKDGEIYIHRNVVDGSLHHRRNRPGASKYIEQGNAAWQPSNIFGNHGCSLSSLPEFWRVYNNTLIARDVVSSAFVPWDIPPGTDVSKVCCSSGRIHGGIEFRAAYVDGAEPPCSVARSARQLPPG